MDVSPLGLGCSVASITGSRVVAGTFTANADGTYVDETTTSGEDTITLAPECLEISGTVVLCERVSAVIRAAGYDSATCASAPNGSCLCDAVFAHDAGLGLVAYASSATGSFITSGSTLTLNDGVEPASYRYCSSSDQLELLPLSTLTPLTGTLQGSVVLGRL